MNIRSSFGQCFLSNRLKTNQLALIFLKNCHDLMLRLSPA